MVPSSTSVTSGEATSSPDLPRNTDADFATRSASRPWPHASWKSTPPPPLLITTGNRPDGAGRARSFEQRALRRRAGELLDVVAVEQLEADRVPDRLVAGLHAGVAARDCAHAEQRLDLIVLGEQAVAVRDEDAAPAVAVRGRHLHDRRARGPSRGVGALQQLDLDGLRDGLGRGDHLVRPVHGSPREIDDPRSAAAAAGRGARGLGRGEQPALGQIGRVRVSGGLTDDDTDAGAAVAAGAQLLDLPVVERRARRSAILREHLREVTTVTQRGTEHLLEDGFLDHTSPLVGVVTVSTCGSLGWNAARTTPYRTYGGVGTRPVGRGGSRRRRCRHGVCDGVG